ncbi:Hypothetical protein SCLAV_0661 [Streptomyces clavuligerus]|uniref:Uncharacterized protein n=1 Tax=Streptomyces clavuligerus TaxID=1901 RepID=E2PUB8_STRCL|nr:Hypothetical protein SCLAV_0661 [Streptomyces clavuligerus]
MERPVAGRFGRVHHRTSDRRTSAPSSNAAGPWGRAPHRGTATGSQAQRPRAGDEGRLLPGGRCDPDGVRRSVDNGSRSTRSQRVPGRPEGGRTPPRTGRPLRAAAPLPFPSASPPVLPSLPPLPLPFPPSRPSPLRVAPPCRGSAGPCARAAAPVLPSIAKVVPVHGHQRGQQ